MRTFVGPSGTAFHFSDDGTGDCVVASSGVGVSVPVSDLVAFVAQLYGQWQEVQAKRVFESSTPEQIAAAEEWRELRRRLGNG